MSAGAGPSGRRGRPHTLHFPQLEREIPCRRGDSILQGARRAGVRIVGACGGRGTCGTCVVRVVGGRVSAADRPGDEPNWLNRRTRAVRACRVTPDEDCFLELPKKTLAPVARTFTCETEQAPLPRDVALSRAKPLRLTDSSRLGLAVDLGTTNLAASLTDLETGRGLASLGIENPQTAWGADLISRLNYAIRGADEFDELRQAVVTGINAVAHDLCLAMKVNPHQIAEVTVCGNTAMQHLLLGLPVKQLGKAPFVAAVRDAVDVGARELRLLVHPRASVHVAATIGGFVGGDHVAALLATQPMWRGPGASLVMDIGTNTEVSLIHGERILSASCPSGPALEGGNISSGMRAAEGAVEHVRCTGDSFELEVIGGGEAVGLCGSGVIDSVASLFQAGVVDRRGRIVAGHWCVKQRAGQRLAELAPDVVLTQDDIRAIQLAKAAIRTAIDLLLRHGAVDTAEVRQVIIAGAFGGYIDLRSAMTIGLLPELPVDHIKQVGNVAADGARRLLISRQQRQRARDLAAACKHLELSRQSDFQKTFLANIGLPPLPG